MADEKTFEKAQNDVDSRGEDASLQRRSAHRFHVGSDAGWPVRQSKLHLLHCLIESLLDVEAPYTIARRRAKIAGISLDEADLRAKLSGGLDCTRSRVVNGVVAADLPRPL